MSVKLSTYNNEAIGTLTMGYFISLSKQLSIAKAMIILPMILHDATARRLRGNSINRSLDEFIIGNVDCLINFNKRYTDFLPVSVNSVMMLREMGIVLLSEDKIIYNSDNTRFNAFSAHNIGNRARALLASVERLVPIIVNEHDWSLYLKLKVFL